MAEGTVEEGVGVKGEGRNTPGHVKTRRNNPRPAARYHIAGVTYRVVSRRERNAPHSSPTLCRSAFSAVLPSNRDWVSDTFRSDLNVVHVASSFSLLPLLSPSRLVPLYLLSPLARPPLTPRAVLMYLTVATLPHIRWPRGGGTGISKRWGFVYKRKHGGLGVAGFCMANGTRVGRGCTYIRIYIYTYIYIYT